MTNVLSMLREAGSIYVDQHFVYTSGKHGSAYINVDPILPNLGILSLLCARMAAPFMGAVDTVAAPATGGIVFSTLVAQRLGGESYDVAAVWADHANGTFEFTRAGFQSHLEGRRVLVVDDIFNTGSSVLDVCSKAERMGADIVGISVLCNRSGQPADQLGIRRLTALVTLNFSAVPATDCELCAKGIPIVGDIGHGDQFKSSHPDYVGGYTTARQPIRR
jgi:orotate phosphoribosyltransferase